jgi:hypothetical protein
LVFGKRSILVQKQVAFFNILIAKIAEAIFFHPVSRTQTLKNTHFTGEITAFFEGVGGKMAPAILAISI